MAVSIFTWYILKFSLLMELATGNYLTVEMSGNLSMMLTASHGGKISSFTPDIPDREDGCFIDGECVFAHNCSTSDPTNCGVLTLADWQTDDLTHRLRLEINKLKHDWPKMVINNIHRKKLDANREVGEATFNEEIPMTVYGWYHGNISAGISMFNGAPGILFDIHGYSNGNEKDWTMLGYLISKSALNNLNDNDLDLQANDSSIKKLAANHPTEGFSNLLRGPASFGAKMELYSLDAVPSPENAGPGSAGYYSGGYTTKTYKDTVDVIQVEVHYFHRKSSEGRQAYAETLARAIVDFYNKYYETNASKSTQYLQSKLLLVTLNILTIIALYISVQ